MTKRVFIFIAVLVVSACASYAPVAQEQRDAPAPSEIDNSAAEPVSSAQADLEPFSLRIDEAMVELEMIPIPEGSITIAGDDSRADVEVGPFWISRTEVSWDLFDVFAFGSADPDEATGEDAILRPSKPYGAPDRGFGHRGYAAISMSYLVAEQFARWLSHRTGDVYRVPTEAEWEYACRAGREDALADEELAEYAWFWDNAFDETHPIGELEPNAFGLHDMLGNAAEWCTGLNGEPLACGGHFLSKAEDVHCGARMTPSPKWQETDPQIPKSRFWLTDGPFMGFRIIRVPQ